MRILVVTNVYPTAEKPFQGTFIRSQVKGLMESGVDVNVLFFDRIKGGRATYALLPKLLREQIEKAKPDLVHTMYGGIMAAIVASSIEVPHIVSFCGSDLLGQMYRNPLKILSTQCGIKASHYSARKSAAVIVKSLNLRRALPRSIPNEKIHTIPNGIDLELFRPLDAASSRKRLGWDPSKFHLLFSGSNDLEVKGFDLARRAHHELGGLGVDSELHILRNIAHEEVPLWLNAANAFLLTSTHEGSPNIVKEAMACGTPIVSVDVGDVKERILGIDGCSIVGANAKDLALSLREISRLGDFRTKGYEIMKPMSIQHIAKRILDVYRSVLARPVCAG